MSSSRLQTYLKDYQSYHTTRGNQWTHILGIPMIVLGLLGLLAQWGWGIPDTVFRFDGGVILLGLGGLFYLGLDWRRGGPFTLVLTGFYFLSRAFPISYLWFFFVLGWIFQGVGHYYFEKRSPAFLKNLTHLLIGPLWIFSKLLDWD